MLLALPRFNKRLAIAISKTYKTPLDLTHVLKTETINEVLGNAYAAFNSESNRRNFKNESMIV